MAKNLLRLIYKPKEIFIVSQEFDDQNCAIAAECCVPMRRQYTAQPLRYVTAENYVRCLSQASYLLGEHILEYKLIPLEMPASEFRAAAARFEIYYRYLAMTFHEQVARGSPFPMRLCLKNWRELRQLQQSVLFVFTNERTVISGEMSYVLRGKK